MKKNYEMPVIDVIELETNDVLTGSVDFKWPWGNGDEADA